MKQNDRPEQLPHLPTTNPFRTWLLGIIITLFLMVMAALLIAPHLIASASFKQKVQELVTEKTGGRIEYQTINLTYLPQPTIELRQISLSIPNRVGGTITTLRISPEILPLLTGQLHLARLEMEAPEFNLNLPDMKPTKSPAQPYMLSTLEKSLAMVLKPLGQVVPNLKLMVSNGQLSISQGNQTQAEINGLTLRLGLSVNDPRSGQANLQAELSKLTIYRNGQHETLKEISLNGSGQMMDSEIKIRLEQLSLTEPALELAGNLSLAPSTPGVALDLSGSNIDIEATRRIALALAGDVSPTKEIFDYLRGGRVSQINFTSRGKTPSGLGDLNNILIKGVLLDGKISIPEIKLDLTEVNGDVNILEGILQGTRMSCRLEGSTGRDGSLSVGLGEDNDLFKLDLTLNADLQQAQPILQRVVNNTTFVAELEKITNLQGTARGRLILGDSLDDITARIEASELNLSADYQRVPFPIAITQGQLTFTEGLIDLTKLSGTLGKSKFADFSGRFLWEENLSLEISSGRFNLDMPELYPWLASQEALRDHLADTKQVNGQIDLSSLTLKGVIDNSQEWQYTSTGTVTDISIGTKIFSDTITLPNGGFKVNTQQLTLQNLQATSLDATLTLTGNLKGFPRQLNRGEISLDGRMGPDSVEWLMNRFDAPEIYAIHAPLNISNAQLTWRPDSTTSLKGAFSLEQGPAITLDVDSHPERLQIRHLKIKDQHSDASMALDLVKEQRDFKFTGNLQHETLESLFVNRQFSSGRLEGNFSVSVPQTGNSKATAEGQLTVEKLPILLPSGDTINIDRLTLDADGSQIKVDITKAAWLGLIWKPVIATVSFDQDRIDVRVAKAKLCGIDAPGLFSFAGGKFSFDTTLKGKDLDLATSYRCLTEGRVKMSGTLDFSSHITAQGKIGDLVEALQGPLKMTFNDGVIEQDKMLADTLEVLNVTEIVKGRLPNLNSTGFAYSTLTVQGKFQSGKLIVDRFHMDGETLDLLGHGEVGLKDEIINAQLMAAPFQTANTVIKHIPGINYLLAGSLVAIPVGITGTLTDPKVEVLAASAVGSSLLGLGERVLEAPVKLIETIIPGGNEKEK